MIQRCRGAVIAVRKQSVIYCRVSTFDCGVDRAYEEGLLIGVDRAHSKGVLT